MKDIEKDAMRYRWLRDTNLSEFRDDMEGPVGSISSIMACINEPTGDSGEGAVSEVIDPGFMDALIDTAMELDSARKILEEFEADGVVWKGSDGRYRLREDVRFTDNGDDTVTITKTVVN
jgi:hypothetical protein